MQVCEVMTPDVKCARPNDTIADAAEKMRELNVGALPVCGDDGKLAGMVTDRDITIRATAEAADPHDVCVGDVMTSGIVYCFEDEPLARAVQLMEEQQIRRVAVLNRDKKLVGIVSLGDVAVKSRDESLAGEALECVSTPSEPNL